MLDPNVLRSRLAAQRKPGPKRRRGIARRRAEAVEIAADMETGRYVDPGGYEWPARPFVVAQILRHMGYRGYTAEQHHLPVWWPGPRGDGSYRSRTRTMRRLVLLKIALRRM